MSICRRNVLGGIGASLLIEPASAQVGAPSDDMVLGAVGAPAELMVYSSASCSHCRDFHNEVWPRLKANYIDRGLLRFVFREAGAPNPEFSAAAFQLARCGAAGAVTYFQRITEIFASGADLIQFDPIIIVSGKVTGGALNLGPLIELGERFGLTAEQIEVCWQGRAGVERAERLLRIEPWRFQVTGFPTLILNDRMLDLRDGEIFTFGGLARAIDVAVQTSQ
jgi:hypothetical protein